MTHSKLKIVDWVQNNNTFGAPPGFGFYSLQQGCFRAQPTQAKKKKSVVDGKSYMAEVDNVGQEWKGICFVFWGSPPL